MSQSPDRADMEAASTEILTAVGQVPEITAALALLREYLGDLTLPVHCCESCGCVFLVDDDGDPERTLYIDRYIPADDTTHGGHPQCGCHDAVSVTPR
jgi:hypothetical protein